MLGNRHVLVYVSSQSEQGGDLLGTLSAGASYLDLTGRISYGFGAFSLGTVYDEELDILRQERRSGVLLYAAYPTSRFERVEGNVVARYSDEYPYRSGPRDRALLVSNYLSYVWDNTNVAAAGELVGSRAYLTLGFTRDVTRGVADYVLVQADLRRSAPLSRSVILASRLEGRSTFGDEGRRFFLGGPSTLRGYGTRTLSGRNVLLVNNELRLPLLARLAFRTPGGTLPLPTIKGALFFDAATSGDRGLDPWRGSVGVGFYLGGGYFPVVRFNVAWRTDFDTVKSKPVREFTVGWNY
jgi:outer membrane protein assembly factor BamA